ncbi:DNase I-like protein [Conidiobolus coronatus NRRL 28638]|uniref:DNase I-like protein n=1 Tax=Conidiobolus coronatus (strain ATCC 28846 / CBS 209.66 / NRRL 28638) TaxID=796925 RepID=A0A137PAL6_CONC2|nr:DNase I-like protein [Conidiobolus coronatus NRRL 28638]|eukprot:KXN72015.1 DNase I-like protein [Conidiobolus coronatus NRRL 28638]
MPQKYLVGAFNVRHFSINKFQDGMDTQELLIKILRRYDIVFLQEVRDKEEPTSRDIMGGTSGAPVSVNSNLIARVVNKVSTPERRYDAVVSSPIGRTNHKERYVYLYRTDLFTPTSVHLFDDDVAGDIFEREPYSVKFRLNSNPSVELGILGVHIKPTEAVKEIGALPMVFDIVVKEFTKPQAQAPPPQPQPNYQYAPTPAPVARDKPEKKWYELLFSCLCGSPDDEDQPSNNYPMQPQQPPPQQYPPPPVSTTLIGPIIMGDLNAGKNYVSKKSQATLEVFTNSEKFKCLIDNDADTTVNTTNYAYDRIIVPSFQQSHFSEGKVYRFDEVFNLTREKALEVSDHYPVEVEVTVY